MKASFSQPQTELEVSQIQTVMASHPVKVTEVKVIEVKGQSEREM
jgi:hypothetical protein